MRFWLMPLALALVTPVSTRVHAAESKGAPDGAPKAGGAEASDEGEAETPAAQATASDEGARPGKRTKRAKHARSSRHGKPLGWVVTEDKLRKEPPPSPSGNIHFFNLANHETLKVNIYNDDGSYNVEALKAVTHILRCKRTDAEKDIDPRLMTVLSHVYDHYQKPLEIVSGFRNQRKQTSYHYKASASDIRIEGVEPKKLRNFVDTLDAGGMGVGLYPRSRFVHIDVRPMPSYRWIDYARSNPDSPDKRPPRGWKHKKRLS